MVDTKKFSEFPTGGVLETGDRPVGLEGSTNTIWDFEGSSGSGESIITVEQDTTMLAVTDWVRMDEATGEYVKAIATDEENAEVAGVVLEILDDTTMRVQQSGYIFPNTPDFNDFTAGVTYFLSDTLLGNQTPAIPTTNGYVKKPVFIATGEDSGWVCCLLAGQVVGTPPPINQSVPSGSDTNIHTVSQSGNKFDVGDAVRVNGDTTYTLALADTPTNALAVGFVRNNGDPNFTIQFAGWCSNVVTSAVDDLGNPIALASGQAYYLSDVDLGSITPNPPTTLGAASRPIFICESHTNLTGWIFAEFPKELEGANEFATRELDNLQNTAVNTNIIPDRDVMHNLGDPALRWANIYAFRLGDDTITNTQPPGTNNLTLATTAFVTNAVAGGGGGGVDNYYGAMPYISGRWYLTFPPGMSSSPGTANVGPLTPNVIRYYPVFIPRNVTIDAYNFRENGGAGQNQGNINIALYASDGTNAFPTGNPIAGTTTGSIALTGGGVPHTVVLGAPVALTAGIYWKAFIFSTGGISVPPGNFLVGYNSLNFSWCHGMGYSDVFTLANTHPKNLAVGYSQNVAYNVVMPSVGALTIIQNNDVVSENPCPHLMYRVV